jgi:hypothetical protein
MNWRLFTQIFNIGKNQPANSHLTEFLASHPIFRNLALKFHFGKESTKGKFMEMLDEAAFPEKYQKKRIEDKSKVRK